MLRANADAHGDVEREEEGDTEEPARGVRHNSDGNARCPRRCSALLGLRSVSMLRRANAPGSARTRATRWTWRRYRIYRSVSAEAALQWRRLISGPTRKITRARHKEKYRIGHLCHATMRSIADIVNRSFRRVERAAEAIMGTVGPYFVGLYVILVGGGVYLFCACQS